MKRDRHRRTGCESVRAKSGILAGLALLFFARKKCCARDTGGGRGPNPTPEPQEASEPQRTPEPEKPPRRWFGGLLHGLTKPIRLEDQAQWHEEDKARAARVKAEKEGAAPPPKPGDKQTKDDEGGSGLTGIVVNILGAIATGVGITGAVIVVGATIFWARFDAIGIPPIQAVTDIPRTELLVQGAQETMIFVLVGLGAALLIALADPKGAITRGTLGVLALLVLGAGIFAVTTTLSWVWVVALIGLALVLSGATIGIGFATQRRLIALLVSVFIASFVFSATCAFVIVETQNFAQAVAIHFGPNKEGKRGKGDGITGIYVTATENTLVYARPPSNGSDELGLYEVPRSEGTTYAVGPLEPIDEDGGSPVRKRAQSMLEHLKADAERLPPPEAESGEGE